MGNAFYQDLNRYYGWTPKDVGDLTPSQVRLAIAAIRDSKKTRRAWWSTWTWGDYLGLLAFLPMAVIGVAHTTLLLLDLFGLTEYPICP
jgi:hypothetical protein